MDPKPSHLGEGCIEGCAAKHAIENEKLRLQVRERQEEIAQLKTRLQTKEKEMQRLRRGILQPLEVFYLFPQLPPEIRNRIWQLTIPPPRIIPVGLKPATPGFDSQRNRFCIDRNDGAGKVSAIGFCQLHEYNALVPEASSRTCRPPLPAIAHTCQESRQLIIHMYNNCFGTCLAPTTIIHARSFLSDLSTDPIPYIVPHRLVTRPGVRFRPQYDIVYLISRSDTVSVWDVLQAARTDELDTGNVQRLIIDIKGFEQLIARLERPNSFFPRLSLLFVTACERNPSKHFPSLKEIEDRARQAIAKYRIQVPGANFSPLHLRFLTWPSVQSLYSKLIQSLERHTGKKT